MYGFPKDLNLDGIVGTQLNQLRLGRWDVQFVFGGSGIDTICVQGTLRLFQADILIAEWDGDTQWTSLDFQKLLNAEVVRWSVPDSNTLEVRFMDELVLQILDDSDEYETAQIYFNDKTLPTIIV